MGNHLRLYSPAGRATSAFPFWLDSRTQAAVALEGTRFGGHRQAGWRATMIDRGKAVDYTRALGTMPNILKEIADSAVALAKGFSVTFRTMLRPTVTENYPHEPAQIEDRYRGVHVLRRDENGMEKCVACFLCAAACPSNCIYIEGAENAAENRISAAERYAKVYNIDYNRCIFCGYCVEACPCDAITHGHEFEIAAYDTNALVYRKEQLLEPLPASATRK